MTSAAEGEGLEIVTVADGGGGLSLADVSKNAYILVWSQFLCFNQFSYINIIIMVIM